MLTLTGCPSRLRQNTRKQGAMQNLMQVLYRTMTAVVRMQSPLQPQISRDSITSQPSSNMGHAYSGGYANGGSLSPTASHELRATSVDRLSSADSLSLPPHVKV